LFMVEMEIENMIEMEIENMIEMEIEKFVKKVFNDYKAPYK